MFITTKGIVLRAYPFKDNNCIAKVFTEDYGLVSFIVKKTKTQIILSQPLTVAEITYRKPKNKELFYVKETHVDYVYNTIMFNHVKLQCAIVLCDILNKCLNEANPSIYKFLIDSFKWLDGIDNLSVGFDSLFLIKFCEHHGISPFTNIEQKLEQKQLNILEGRFVPVINKSDDSNIVPLKESMALYNLSKLNYDNLSDYNISENTNESIFNYLILYLSTHLTELKSIKSIKLLKDLV